jgi:hypothetical protein
MIKNDLFIRLNLMLKYIVLKIDLNITKLIILFSKLNIKFEIH